MAWKVLSSKSALSTVAQGPITIHGNGRLCSTLEPGNVASEHQHRIVFLQGMRDHNIATMGRGRGQGLKAHSSLESRERKAAMSVNQEAQEERRRVFINRGGLGVGVPSWSPALPAARPNRSGLTFLHVLPLASSSFYSALGPLVTPSNNLTRVREGSSECAADGRTGRSPAALL